MQQQRSRSDGCLRHAARRHCTVAEAVNWLTDQLLQNSQQLSTRLAANSARHSSMQHDFWTIQLKQPSCWWTYLCIICHATVSHIGGVHLSNIGLRRVYQDWWYVVQDVESCNSFTHVAGTICCSIRTPQDIPDTRLTLSLTDTFVTDCNVGHKAREVIKGCCFQTLRCSVVNEPCIRAGKDNGRSDCWGCDIS